MAVISERSVEIAFDTSALPDCQEISHHEFLSSFLTDQALTDLSLLGNDGQVVRANRLVLAARSKVFRSMLLGEFAEARKDVIPLNYKGCVLQAILEYILTDSAELLRKGALLCRSDEDEEENNNTNITPSPSHDDDDDHNPFERVKTLVSLMGAAIYFNLPLLCEKVFQHLAHCLKKEPSLSFAVLEAYKQEAPAIPTQLKNLAMSKLSTNIETLDEKCGVSLLSASSLEEILKDNTIQADEQNLFELVLQWAEHEDNDNDNHHHDRSLAASEMIQHHVRLDWIDPEYLSTTVSESNLVSQKSLLEAFKLQALAAKKQHNVVFRRRRCQPVWNSTLTEMSTAGEMRGVDMLQYPSMSSGVHRWTMEVVKDVTFTWLGVALPSKPLDLHKWLGKQDAGWAYGSNGAACHQTDTYNCVHPKFKEGSRVTMTLNLLANNEEKNGTLSASVDGGEEFILFDNLRAQLVPGQEDCGFVPAVSNRAPAKIRLIDIERLC
ncbi:expressed unknown protein [Seminavis robusta]|uniref:BTB domain-containing protein n=1 Tax=Seminavis robusta TaxID=568900 RepID=A0A9N8EW36_9STRA|nr:expressed unknown protein [Seminavis robusta]|eukprot:Sro1861_g302180.1 n/a (494) ;mRNA; r:10683-12164